MSHQGPLLLSSSFVALSRKANQRHDLPANRETVDLTLHRDVGKVLLGGVKLVRYQINPQPAWGPARAAVKGAAKKQKKTVEGDEAGEQ